MIRLKMKKDSPVLYHLKYEIFEMAFCQRIFVLMVDHKGLIKFYLLIQIYLKLP